MNNKKRMLLHCCCAPCASYVLEHLVSEYDITAFFYNPNIEPRAEYDKRKNELQKLLSAAEFASYVELLDNEYENEAFVNAVTSYRDQKEGEKRCLICFEMRLEKTAQAATSGKYDIFATTMSVSPLKNARILNEIGIRLSEEFAVEYLSADFKKKNGYLRSVDLSKQYKIYRQEYCGCES